MSCPLCRQRKGKRSCPAKGAMICPHCCGTKRLVEIDCPEACVYLHGAHAGAWEGQDNRKKKDLRRLAPYVQALDETQAQLLFVALVGIGGIRARRRELDDRMLAQALTALRKTVETRDSGILYEHAPEDMRAQGILHDLDGVFEAEGEDEAPRAPADRDLLAILKALDAALADCLREGEGPTTFLDAASRLVAELAPERTPSRPLIVEP